MKNIYIDNKVIALMTLALGSALFPLGMIGLLGIFLFLVGAVALLVAVLKIKKRDGLSRPQHGFGLLLILIGWLVFLVGSGMTPFGFIEDLTALGIVFTEYHLSVAVTNSMTVFLPIPWFFGSVLLVIGARLRFGWDWKKLILNGIVLLSTFPLIMSLFCLLRGLDSRG